MADEYGTVQYVSFVRGTNDDGTADVRMGLVLEDLGDKNLRLGVVGPDGLYIEDKEGEGVPNREPEDWENEGGDGLTWYYPRD